MPTQGFAFLLLNLYDFAFLLFGRRSSILAFHNGRFVLFIDTPPNFPPKVAARDSAENENGNGRDTEDTAIREQNRETKHE